MTLFAVGGVIGLCAAALLFASLYTLSRRFTRLVMRRAAYVILGDGPLGGGMYVHAVGAEVRIRDKKFAGKPPIVLTVEQARAYADDFERHAPRRYRSLAKKHADEVRAAADNATR